MGKHLSFLIPFITLSSFTFAQIGGSQSFEFLNTASNATIFALGGENVSLRNNDNNHFWQNPASLDSGFDNFVSYNYNPYYADIKNHVLSYTFRKKSLGNFGVGVSYFNYGNMKETDPTGAVLGEFRSADYVINLSYARRFENFSYGSSLKFANSSIASYNASAILIDLGGQFIHPREDFTIGMVFRNIGFPLRKYTEESNFRVPFDVRLGASFKPEYMPVRFSTTIQRLYRYDILYDDPNTITGFDENGDPIRDEPSEFEKISQHFIFGTELLLAKGFSIQTAYNFMRRTEMQIEDRKGMVGFSFGMLLKIKSVQFALARSVDHISGATTKFTLTTDLDFFTKNKI